MQLSALKERVANSTPIVAVGAFGSVPEQNGTAEIQKVAGMAGVGPFTYRESK